MSARLRRRSVTGAAWLSIALSLGGVSPVVAASAAHVLSGRAVDEGGKPVPGVTVELSAVESRDDRARRWLAGGALSRPAIARFTAGEDGVLTVELPRPGRWRLRASAPGFVPSSLNVGPLLCSPLLPDLVLRPGSELVVRVTDVAGRPVAGAAVVAGSEPEPEPRGVWSPALREAKTDISGRARLLRPRRWWTELRARTADGLLSGFSRDEGQVEVRSGDDHRLLRLVDRSGEPAVGVLAFPLGARLPLAVSGENGVVRLPERPERDSAIDLIAADGRWARYELNRPTVRPSDPIVLRDPVELEIRVVETGSGRPVPGALLSASGADPTLVVRTDVAGVATFRLASSPEVSIRVDAAGYLPTATRPRSPSTEAIEIELRRGGFVSGIVVDPSGRSVAGARLELLAGWASFRDMAYDVALSLEQNRGPMARTDEAGGFRAGPVFPGMVRSFEVIAAGFAPTRFEIAALAPGEERRGLRWVLEPASRAVGRVVDRDTGGPVEGAEVLLFDAVEGFLGRSLPTFDLLREYAAGTTRSDVEGAFVIPGLGSGLYEVGVWVDGFADARHGLFELAAPDNGWDLGTLELRRSAPIEGRVVDRQGESIAGAWVVAGRAEEIGPQAGCYSASGWPRTDADGRFSLRRYAAGERPALHACGDGYTPSTPIAIEAPTVESIELVLERASGVVGRVVDSSGRALAGVEVHAVLLLDAGTASSSANRTLTDSEGRFVLDRLRPGRLELEVSGAGYVPRRWPLELGAGEVADDLSIELAPGASLVVTVRAADGSIVDSAEVSAHSLADPRDSSHVPFAGADGRYRLEGLAPGKYAVNAQHPAYLGAMREVSIGADTGLIELVLPGGWPITGTVVGVDGTAAGGVPVRLRSERRGGGYESATVRSGPDGGFEFPVLRDGTYALRVYEHSRVEFSSPTSVEVAGGGVHGVQLRLERGGALFGRLLGVERDELVGVEISAREARGVARGGRVHADGTYRIEGLWPSDWVVLARSALGRAAATVTLEPGTIERQLDLDLDTGGTLRGVVFGAQGPVAGARISLRTEEAGPGDPGFRGAVLSDPAGRFVVDRVPPGRLHISALSRDGARRDQKTIELRREGEVTLELRGGTVSGRVVSAVTGEAVGGAHVSLKASAGHVWSGQETATAEGTFRIGGAFGECRVHAFAEGYARRSLSVQVDDGGEREIVIALQPETGDAPAP